MNLTQKHLFLIVALLFGTVSIKAGEPIRWGVVGGMNLSNIKANMDNRLGFHAGVKVEYTLFPNFYLESGLFFTQKGYKIDVREREYTIDHQERDMIIATNEDGKVKKNILELPIHVGYKYKVHPKISIFGSMGVYFGYGLSGKTKALGAKYYLYPIKPAELGEPIFFDTDPYPQNEFYFLDTKTYDVEKRFDWGLGLKAGVEAFNHLQLSVSYDWGINKLYSGTSKGNNRNLMVSVAYMFN